MPPRLRVSLPLRTRNFAGYSPLRPLAPQIPLCAPTKPQQRCASILTKLSNVPSSYGHRIRRGRGPSSGKGKTAGRGHKGQKQHGKVPAGFEGGQTPLHIVHGIRGAKNLFLKDIQVVPLSRILSWIAQGRIDPTKPITPRELIRSRCVHRVSDGIKLLSESSSHNLSIDDIPPLSQPLNIFVSRASASAIAAVEKVGGTVTTRYYTKTALQEIAKGKMDPIVSLRSSPEDTAKWKSETTFFRRLPDPTGRKDIEYYRDAKHRGYLAHTVEEGGIPSLYFKTARQERLEKRAALTREIDEKGVVAQKGNSLW